MAIAAYLAGWLEPLESSWLDYLFRHANRIEADPRIVLVDINDAALERIHRWPWPRRLQADLVDVLHECHAGAVLLDLVYTEPTPREIRHPALEPEYAVDRPAEILGDVSMQDAIDGDRELADAIARAGNVYVAMYFRMSAPGHDPEELRSRSRQLLDENPGASLEEYARAIGRPADDALRSLYDQARVDHLLRDDFGLEVEAVAARLRLPPKDVELFFSDAKEKAARLLVDRFLDQRPAAAFPEVLASLLPGRTAQADSPDRRDLLRAYWRYTAARHILQRATPFDPLRHGRLPVGTDLAVPIEAIARAARGVGFVTFEKDADGVVRHLPLWAVVERRVVPQLGFALACDVLDIDLAAVRFPEVGVLTMTDRSGAHEWRIPLDDQGRMLLNWHIDRAAPSWERSFQHVPVARVAEVALNRRVIEDNRARLALRTAEAVALMYEGATSAYLDYEAKVRRWNELCRAHRNGVGASPTASRPVDGAAQPAQIEALRAELDAVEQTALRHLARLAAEVGDLAPADDRERELFPRIRRLHRELADGSLAATLDAQNEALLRRNEQLLAELEARIGGRLCLVGHVAAAQADMVNTPVFANMPGVMAHANLINTLLQNRIPRVVSRAVTVLLILVTGLLITLLASGSVDS